MACAGGGSGVGGERGGSLEVGTMREDWGANWKVGRASSRKVSQLKMRPIG